MLWLLLLLCVGFCFCFIFATCAELIMQTRKLRQWGIFVTLFKRLGITPNERHVNTKFSIGDNFKYLANCPILFENISENKSICPIRNLRFWFWQFYSHSIPIESSLLERSFLHMKSNRWEIICKYGNPNESFWYLVYPICYEKIAQNLYGFHLYNFTYPRSEFWWL